MDTFGRPPTYRGGSRVVTAFRQCLGQSRTTREMSRTCDRGVSVPVPSLLRQLVDDVADQAADPRRALRLGAIELHFRLRHGTPGDVVRTRCPDVDHQGALR